MVKKVLILILLCCACLQSCAKKENKELPKTEALTNLQKAVVGIGGKLWQDIPKTEITVEFPEEFVVKSGRLMRYQGTEKDVIIPDGISVIEKNAFAENQTITSVRLPEGVTSIQESAFFHCNNLKEVVVPDTLESVGAGAFEWCANLEYIDLHLVKNLRAAAFSGCKKLKSADLSSIEEIGEGAFLDAGIEEITGLENIKKAGDGIFQGTPLYIKYLTDGEGLFIRGNLLIFGSHAEGTVEIPEGVKIILDKAFYKNHQIVHVTFPDTVLEIGKDAFAWCDQLEEIDMPDSIVRLGSGAFMYCSGLQQIRLSRNLSGIPAYCFEGCDTKRITVPQGCSLADDAFSWFGIKGCQMTFPPDAKNMGNIFLYLDDDGKEIPEIMENYCFYTTDISEKNSLARTAKEHGWKLEVLQLEATELTLRVGDTYVLRFNSGADAIWEISDDKVLSLEEEGVFCERKLTARKKGTAVVTAKIYGEEYTCIVNVVE